MAMKKRLGEMLIEAGVIDQNQLQAALGYQRQWGGRLGHALVEMKLTTEAHIVEALAAKFGYEVVRPGALEPGPIIEAAVKLVPREFAVRNNLVPYAADTGSISIAMSDPANIAALDELRFRTGRRVKVALAGDQEIGQALRRYYPDESEGQIEGISLDLEDGDPSNEIETDNFGGGTTEELEQFFGAGATAAPERPPAPTGAAPSVAAAAHPLAGHPAVHAGPRAPAAAPQLAPSASPVEAEEPVEGEPILATDLGVEEPGKQRPDAGRLLTDEELAMVDALEQLAHGDQPDPLLVKPVQMIAALIRLLIRKKVIDELEFLEELRRK